MNGVEKLIMQACIDEMSHVVKVYRSLGERGQYPQELVPFYIDGSSMDTHPLFLGKQGYIELIRTMQAAKELLAK